MDSYIYLHIFLILLLYAGLYLSFYGWGYATSRILKLGIHTSSNHYFTVIWTGWAITLLIFQFIHIFFRLDWHMSVLVYSLGGIFSLIAISQQILRFRKTKKQLKNIRLTVYFSIMLVIASWLAFKGMGPVQNYDSGLYHFNIIRWINSYQIIPGLGNLHDRLAFNQSYFIYAASLNFYPYFPYAQTTPNSFLFLLVYAQITWHLSRVFPKRTAISNTNPTIYISYVFALLLTTYFGLTSKDLTSPTPDLASSLIQIVLFLWFTQIIIGIRKSTHPDELISVLLILATTLITIKLSNLFFSASIISIFVILVKDKMALVKKNTRVVLLVGTMMAVWVIRGVYLSGYPFFPLTFGAIPLDWAISKEATQGSADWIYSWARMPKKHPSEVLGNWNWIPSWFARLTANHKNTVIWPIFLTTGFGIAAIVVAFFTRKLTCLYTDLIFFVPNLIGILYWFFTAPDPRFANALFFLLLLSAILVFEHRLRDLIGTTPSKIVFSITFLISMLLLIGDNYSNIKSDFKNDYTPIQEVSLVEKRTDSGLTVYVPEKGDQCWDSPLPCTPYFNPTLRLRTPLEMKSGFTKKQ